MHRWLEHPLSQRQEKDSPGRSRQPTNPERFREWGTKQSGVWPAPGQQQKGWAGGPPRGNQLSDVREHPLPEQEQQTASSPGARGGC